MSPKILGTFPVKHKNMKHKQQINEINYRHNRRWRQLSLQSKSVIFLKLVAFSGKVL